MVKRIMFLAQKIYTTNKLYIKKLLHYLSKFD